jgi:hypothetical protein
MIQRIRSGIHRKILRKSYRAHATKVAMEYYRNNPNKVNVKRRMKIIFIESAKDCKFSSFK